MSRHHHRRLARTVTVGAVAALSLVGTGVGGAGADPITDSLEALPAALIGGPSTLEWVPSGRAIPVTYTNNTTSPQTCWFRSADATAVRAVEGLANPVAAIPQLARVVVDVGDATIGASTEPGSPVRVAPGASTSWIKPLLPGRAYGVYARCTLVDEPQTIEVTFTYYP